MRERPLVSVAIATRDRSGFVARVIDSVLAQTWRPIEIVIVDDGSTDDTPELLQRYAARFPDIVRPIRQENAGSAAALNTAIRAATSEFVAMSGDDDTFLPQKFRRQMPLFESTDAELTFTAHWRCYGEEKVLARVPNWKPEKDRLIELLLTGCAIAPSTVIARKQPLLDVGIFDESMPPCEDWDLWFRLALRGIKIAYLDEPLTFYRVHPSTLSQQAQDVNAAAERIFRRVFSSAVLPERFRARADFYFARCHLNAAVRSYNGRDGASVRQELLKAFRRRPASLRPGWLAMYLNSFLLANRPPRTI